MTKPTATNAKAHEHRLPEKFLSGPVNVLLVGCGGTGSAMATGLVYLHQALLTFGHPHGLRVTLVDGDRISQANCVRQPFSESEIGLYKADVLATRINLFWGLDWQSDISYVDRRWRFQRSADLLISCVDTRAARQEITQSEAYRDAVYWLDLGNNADSGQFVLGQPPSAPCPKDVRRIPTIADLFPEIIDPDLDARDKLPSCSALEALESQSPFINQALAYQALGMLAQFFRHGILTYHGGFLNLASGRMSPLPLDAGVWDRISSSHKTKRRRSGMRVRLKIPA